MKLMNVGIILLVFLTVTGCENYQDRGFTSEAEELAVQRMGYNEFGEFVIDGKFKNSHIARSCLARNLNTAKQCDHQNEIDTVRESNIDLFLRSEFSKEYNLRRSNEYSNEKWQYYNARDVELSFTQSFERETGAIAGFSVIYDTGYYIPDGDDMKAVLAFAEAMTEENNDGLKNYIRRHINKDVNQIKEAPPIIIYSKYRVYAGKVFTARIVDINVI